jgi:hypothetical protein
MQKSEALIMMQWDSEGSMASSEVGALAQPKAAPASEASSKMSVAFPKVHTRLHTPTKRSSQQQGIVASYLLLAVALSC